MKGRRLIWGVLTLLCGFLAGWYLIAVLLSPALPTPAARRPANSVSPSAREEVSDPARITDAEARQLQEEEEAEVRDREPVKYLLPPEDPVRMREKGAEAAIVEGELQPAPVQQEEEPARIIDLQTRRAPDAGGETTRPSRRETDSEVEVQRPTQQPQRPTSAPRRTGSAQEQAPKPAQQPPLVEPEQPRFYGGRSGGRGVPPPRAESPSLVGYLGDITQAELQRLIAKQARYITLRWRKFVGVSKHFIVWAPGQLYYSFDMPSDDIEIYFCEHDDVTYGAQRKPLDILQVPVGITQTRTFLIQSSRAWLKEFFASDAAVRVYNQQFKPDSRLPTQDVLITGSQGESRLRVILDREHNALYWFWAGYKNTDKAKQRFSLFVESVEFM